MRGLSNVAGPAGQRTVAGYRQWHKIPVPIIGSGRFLNITSRRSGDILDTGVIADPEGITAVARIAVLFAVAEEGYSRLVRAQHGERS